MRPITILYVEDSEDLRETIGMLLEQPDREISLCATGEEALDELARRDYDILVTDVSLPGISGADLARRLLATRPDHQVVLCSGYEFGEWTRQFGPNVHAVQKPFEPEELHGIIDKISASLRAEAVSRAG